MINHPIQNILACIAITTFGLTSAYSQTDTIKLTDYEALSLENILSVKIISGGKIYSMKGQENFFDPMMYHFYCWQVLIMNFNHRPPITTQETRNDNKY